VAQALASAVLCAPDAGCCVYWWSNAAALRSALSLRLVWDGGEPGGAPPPEPTVAWLQAALVRVEAAACGRAAEAAWAAALAPRARAPPPPPPRKAGAGAAEEAWAAHWLGGLEAAEAALGGGAECGAMPLQPQALSRLLARLDAALFNSLLRPAAAWPGPGSGPDPLSARAAAPGGGDCGAAAAAAARALCARAAAWAASRLPAAAAAPLPLLAAAAEVLTAPGEGSTLAAPQLRALLARLAAEGPPGVIPPAALEAAEAAARAEGRSAGREARRAARAGLAGLPAFEYAPPDAAALGADWLSHDGFPLDQAGLEAVEDPLAALEGAPAGSTAAAEGAEADARFAALRAAWGV